MDSLVTVTGEELADNARRLVLLGESMEAFFLMKKIVSDKDAFSILRGYKTLTGSNKVGYKVVDDETDTYFEKLQNSYAGKCYMGGHYYEPYAITDDLQDEDIPMWILARCRTPKEIAKVKCSYAVSLWGDDLTSDRAEYIKDPEFFNNLGGDGPAGFVIWKKTTRPPFWVAKQTKTKEALEEYVEAFGPLVQLIAKNVVPFKPAALPPPASKSWSGSYTYTPPKTATPEEIEALREKILAQAKDFLEVEADGVVYRIPKAPFEHWALEARPELASPWEPVSPKGLSYGTSTPARSDWMIGAGIPLDSYYKTQSGIMLKAGELADQLREKHLESKAEIFGTTSAYGASGKIVSAEDPKSYYGLYVVDEAKSDYIHLALSGSAIIAEKPGKLVKMAQVPGSGIVVAVVPNAREKFPVGCNVQIDGKKGVIRLTGKSYSYSGYSGW